MDEGARALIAEPLARIEHLEHHLRDDDRHNQTGCLPCRDDRMGKGYAP